MTALDDIESDPMDFTCGALHVICRGIPEHARLLRDAFSQYGIRVIYTSEIDFKEGEIARISPEAGPQWKVVFFPPVLHSLMWLIINGGWELMRDYSSTILAWYSGAGHTFDGEEIERMTIASGSLGRGAHIFEHAKRLARGDDVEAPLPEWLKNIGDSEELEHQAVRELWLLGTVWVLLHEFNHVAFAINEEKFNSILEEERKADIVASNWLLGEVEEYARVTGEEISLVRAKRAMGALSGLFCVALLDRKYGYSDHPPIRERISILLDRVDRNHTGLFWQFAAGLIYILAANRLTVRLAKPKTFPELVLMLAEHL